MIEKTLKEYLEGITKDQLAKKMKIAGFRYTGLDKRAIVGALEEYLLDERNIERAWSNLSPFEKEYVDEFIRYGEKPHYKKLENMYRKYGINGSYKREPWEEQSIINLLFIGKVVPPQIKTALKKYLTPIVIKYDTLEQLPAGEIYRLNVIGESFAADFCSVINLVKSIGLALTKEKQMPAKSAVVKIHSVLSNKDFVFKHPGQIDKIHSIEDTNRIYGIIMLLAESNLLLKNGETMSVSDEAERFFGMGHEDKCRYLFKHYLKSKGIYELGRIVESDYKTELKGNMSECRNVIIKHLKNCPVGKWVSTAQFLDYIKMLDKNFLMEQVKDISYFSDKYRVYLEPWVEWEEVEGRFIEVVLQEYLSVLGIVDTFIYESKGGCSDYDELPFFKVEYFRLTPLGAYVLGIAKDYHYEEQVNGAGFTVEAGFQIKVMNEQFNQVHKLFFERFASKEEYPQYCIYKLSFGAIARALDKGITIENIAQYIRSHSYNGIPSECGALLQKWMKYSDKVVIKNIMIVQMENNELMKELQEEFGLRQYMASDLSNAFEISPDAALKVKRELEKGEYYCRIL